MELLVCVINRPELLDEVLTGLLEAGVTGSTVIESRGMGRIIMQDVPIFSGFQSLFAGAHKSNITIFSVIKEPPLVDEAIKVIKEIYGTFDEPSTGILFTLPVTRCEGLAQGTV